jgi:transposase-like protein
MLFYEHGPGRIQTLMYQLPESCSHAVMEIAVAFVQIRCPSCQHTDVIQHGITAQGTQRYRGKNPSCPQQTFLREYRHHGRMPAVKQQILEMTLNGSGIRDIARVLHISPTTVIAELKKRSRSFNTSTRSRSNG